MGKIAHFIAMFLFPLLLNPAFAALFSATDAPTSALVRPQQSTRGAPVYLRIFKEEKTLELYVKQGDDFRLFRRYPVCSFSGGLGPKRYQGDYKSPEGFYRISAASLNPNSRFHRAINIGFPNAYDRAHGYTGKYLMIHGNCVSVGCYAMTDAYMSEIYAFVRDALQNGQTQVAVSIYPFRMTDENMQRHRHAYFHPFWQQLKPGYDYFERFHQPPPVTVRDGRYVLSTTLTPSDARAAHSQLAFTKTK